MTPQEKAQQLPHWQDTVNMIRDIGGRYRDEPVTLKDGRQTHVYLDPKGVLSTGGRMKLASQAMLEHAKALGLDYTAVGGPTMGGDVLAHGMTAHSDNPDLKWFSVRSGAKPYGVLPKSAGGWIEGSELGPQDRVLLTDDVADTGHSLVDAYHRITSTGAKVSAVMPMVERGDQAGPQFEKMGIPYHPLMHYNDLGINTLSNPPAAP
jgi:orotate phosphoribosyltransferase